MSDLYQNLTKLLLLQNAIGGVLIQIASEIDSHAICIISNAASSGSNIDSLTQANINSLHLNELPTIIADCQMFDNGFTAFIKQVQNAVTLGSSFFVVSEMCSLPFLDNFHEIHDWVPQKYEKKILVVIDTRNKLSYVDIMDILQHRIVINGLLYSGSDWLRKDIPLTLLLQPDIDKNWIDIWSAFPYNSCSHICNRFFLSNLSKQYDKPMIPKISDLNGLPVVGAFINYPPYSAHYHVSTGTGNANIFASNETLSIQLNGQEQILLVEFCLKYNCSLTARLEYDNDLWGESFENHTGNGLLGALTMREANVSCAALYLWEEPYAFTQYTSIIQRATATFILSKPLPLPYWKTPILPFPGYIWGYVIGAFLIGAVILFIVNATKININFNKQKSLAVGQPTYELFNSIYMVFRISIFQSVNIRIDFLSNAVIFMALLTYALVIGNLYTSGLASVMTIIHYEEPVDSLEKLVESKLLWGGTTTSWTFALRHSDYPPHQKFISKFIVKSIPEVFKLVQQHKMAVALEILQDGSFCYQSFMGREESKDYMTMKHPMYWQATVIMTTKTWPFMEQLNRIVFMQLESGIRHHWEHIATTRTMNYDIQRNIEGNGKPPEGVGPKKLSIQYVLGALFLLLFGSIVATIIFFAEFLLDYKTRILAQPLQQMCARKLKVPVLLCLKRMTNNNKIAEKKLFLRGPRH